MRLFSRLDRRLKLARTYMRGADDLLYIDWHGDIPPLYWDLLEHALILALDITEKLPDDFFASRDVDDFFGLGGGRINLSDTPFERAEKLMAALQKRRRQAGKLRRIKLLENVTGRTPEEAEAFRAKAAELRQQSE
jgi:hypothetical protein